MKLSIYYGWEGAPLIGYFLHRCAETSNLHELVCVLIGWSYNVLDVHDSSFLHGWSSCPLFLAVSALICFGCNLDGPPLCMVPLTSLYWADGMKYVIWAYMGFCKVSSLCMVFHLIWMGESFWLAILRSLNVMMKGLCMLLHVALFAWWFSCWPLMLTPILCFLADL